MESVLVIADFNATGGTGTYLKRVLDYLVARFQVRLVLHEDQRRNTLVPFLLSRGIAVTFDYVLFPRLDNFLRRVFRRLGLSIHYLFVRDTLVRLRLEKKYKPSRFFISQGGGCNYFAFLLSSLPCAIITHSLFTDPINRSRAYLLYLRLFRPIDRRTKRICCVSEYARRLFIKNIMSVALAEITTVIPNFGEEAAGGSCIRQAKITVLTLGHVIAYKDPKTWLRVALKVCGRYPGDVRFIWAGSGEMLSEMRALASGLTDIQFIGYVPEPATLYAEADIYFQPSMWESQGISVVEAMAYGLPCVVSNAGGLPESVLDDSSGTVCDIHDVEGFVRAITELIQDPQKRERQGRVALDRYRNVFTKERWESKMNELLGICMESRS